MKSIAISILFSITLVAMESEEHFDPTVSFHDVQLQNTRHITFEGAVLENVTFEKSRLRPQTMIEKARKLYNKIMENFWAYEEDSIDNDTFIFDKYIR